VMLNYQSLSFHDALFARSVLGLKRAPEFEQWLVDIGIAREDGSILPVPAGHPLLLAIAPGEGMQ